MIEILQDFKPFFGYNKTNTPKTVFFFIMSLIIMFITQVSEGCIISFQYKFQPGSLIIERLPKNEVTAR